MPVKSYLPIFEGGGGTRGGGRYPRPIHSWHRKQSGSLVGTGSLLGLFLARSQGQSSATTDDELIATDKPTRKEKARCAYVLEISWLLGEGGIVYLT